MQVDLREPAKLRWVLTAEQAAQARELMGIYQRDLGLPASLVSQIARPAIRNDYWNELEGIASSANIPMDDVVCGNVYYDALKAVLVGCTAFAVDTPTGPLHARNLDWWTENDSLRRYTATTRFIGARGGEFTTVGWPGFAGVFSAVAPGRFAVTLNAVVSGERWRAASPVVFLLRQVLDEALDFQSALQTLSETPLASDSFLLLTGARASEMAVIERTPSRAEVRFAENGSIFVANDYRIMRTRLPDLGSRLRATSCSRFDRLAALVASRMPEDAEKCFDYLSEPGVQMGITVQQMVFQASTGLTLVR